MTKYQSESMKLEALTVNYGQVRDDQMSVCEHKDKGHHILAFSIHSVLIVARLS